MTNTANVGRVVKVSGPLVVAENMSEAKMYDVVRVSEQRLIGEVIEVRGDNASIQVYEETGGLGPGEPVYVTGMPLSVELGPGLIESIYDGIQRPLDEIYRRTGDRIARGVDAYALNRTKNGISSRQPSLVPKWARGYPGHSSETTIVVHKIMVPPGISGKLVFCTRRSNS